MPTPRSLPGLRRVVTCGLLVAALALQPVATPPASAGIVPNLKKALRALVHGQPADRALWHGAAFNQSGITPNQRMAAWAAEYSAGAPRRDEARAGMLGWLRGTFMVDELMGYNGVYLAAVGVALQRAVAIGDRELETALRDWLRWWAAMASLHATPSFDTFSPGGRSNPTDEGARAVLELLATGSARDPWGNPRSWERRDYLLGAYVVRLLVREGVIRPDARLAPGNVDHALAVLADVRLPYPVRWTQTSQGWYSYAPQGTAAPYHAWNDPRYATSYVGGKVHQLRFEGTLHRNHSGEVELRNGTVGASLPNGWRQSIPVPGGTIVRSVEIYHGVRVLQGPAVGSAGGATLPGPTGGGQGDPPGGASPPGAGDVARGIADRLLPGLGEWLDRLGSR